jgi:hypothetical protein
MVGRRAVVGRGKLDSRTTGFGPKRRTERGRDRFACRFNLTRIGLFNSPLSIIFRFNQDPLMPDPVFLLSNPKSLLRLRHIE